MSRVLRTVSRLRSPLTSASSATNTYPHLSKFVCVINNPHSIQNTRNYITPATAKSSNRNDRAFKVLKGEVDKTTEEFQSNAKHHEAVTTKYKQILAVATGGGGEKATKRHTEVNKKLLPTDRLKHLLDDYDSYLEFSALSGMGLSYGNIPRGGVFTGIGKIRGTYCIIVANDGSIKGGTLFPITVKKVLRALEIASENKLPVVYLVDSGGAFLPLQAEIFPDRNTGGRSFYEQAVFNSRNLPQLAIVCGSCTAGGAYIPSMCQEAVMVHKIGTIFLGGPPLVYAATGEIVNEEQLGGATLHCSVSGGADHFAETESEAFEIGRDVVTTFNIPVVEPNEDYEEPIFDINELPGLIPKNNQHLMDMYKVIARITDGSRFQEFKARYGTTLITGFADLKGHLVGIVGNQGDITSDAACKGAHFVGICDQRNIPVIFLQNTVPETEEINSLQKAEIQGDQIKAQAKLMSAVACCQVPKMTVIVGNSFGPSNFMMGGRSFSPRFLFSWPNAQIGIDNPKKLVEITLKETEESLSSKQDENKDVKKEITTKVLQQTSSIYGSSRVWDDGIILPQETRDVLAQCLLIYKQTEVVPNTELKMPVIRM